MEFYVMSLSGNCGCVEVEDRDSLPEELELPGSFWKIISCIIYKKWWRYHIENIQTDKKEKISFIKDEGLYYATALGQCGFAHTKKEAMIDLLYKFTNVKKEFMSASTEDCHINLYNH